MTIELGQSLAGDSLWQMQSPFNLPSLMNIPSPQLDNDETCAVYLLSRAVSDLARRSDAGHSAFFSQRPCERARESLGADASDCSSGPELFPIRQATVNPPTLTLCVEIETRIRHESYDEGPRSGQAFW